MTDSCDAMLRTLGGYLDGDLDPALCRELEGHLRDCAACRLVLDNLRHTAVLYREGRPTALPEGFSQRLHAALNHRWRQRTA